MFFFKVKSQIHSYMLIGGPVMNELFERIIHNALIMNATDIHLLSRKTGIIRFRINGQIRMFEKLENDVILKLINYIRYVSKIDLNYHLKPQTGHYSYEHDHHIYHLRVSNLVGKDSETLVIRILNNHPYISLNNISQINEVKQFLNDIVTKERGLFIISGATGSGKSTTLYALLDEIYRIYNRNIITIEDPIEIEKDYCLQIELNEKQGINYEQSLKQILRHDPDIIMIGEIRDQTTAALALTCSLTGHLVLTTLHASHCINTMKRLINLGLTKLDLCDVVIGVMTQKIIYDKQEQLIVISEFMRQEEVYHYLNDQQTDYFDFHKAKNILNAQGINYE